MLWFFRKVCGAIILTCLASWLLFLIALLFDPRVAALAGVVGLITLWAGGPAFIVWAVLKIISVLSAPRVEQPSSVVALYPPHQVSTSGVLGLATPAAVARAKHTAPTSSASPAEPDVYTYSAPGVPMCPECGHRPVIFYCSTHKSAVCLECVAGHDEPRECVYVPAFRVPWPDAIP
jgi:hypothetical protein